MSEVDMILSPVVLSQLDALCEYNIINYTPAIVDDDQKMISLSELMH